MIITFTLQSTTDGSLMTGQASNTTVYISKDFGAYSQSTNSVTEIGRGEYKLELTSAESTYTTELHYQPVCTGAMTNTYAVSKDIVIPSDYAKSAEITALQNHGDTDWSTADTSTLATSSALATVGTNVTAVKAKTDNLPTAPASTSDVTGAVTSIEQYGDTKWLTASGFATSTALAKIHAGLYNWETTTVSSTEQLQAKDASGTAIVTSTITKDSEGNITKMEEQ